MKKTKKYRIMAVHIIPYFKILSTRKRIAGSPKLSEFNFPPWGADSWKECDGYGLRGDFQSATGGRQGGARQPQARWLCAF